MKYYIFILFLFTYQPATSQVNTTWKYHKLTIKQQTDSLFFFNADSLHNLYSLEKIRITFKSNNVYEALYFNGEKREGFWKIENQQLIIDQDTNRIVVQNSNTLKTEADIVSVDMGYYLTGKIITELKKIPDCSIFESVSSGNWNDPSIWSCDRVPNKDDNITIRTGHTITLTQAMGFHNCKNLVIQTGGNFIVNGKMYLFGD